MAGRVYEEYVQGNVNITCVSHLYFHVRPRQRLKWKFGENVQIQGAKRPHPSAGGLLGVRMALETSVPSLEVSVGGRIGRRSLAEGLLKGSMASWLGLSSRPSRDSGSEQGGAAVNLVDR